VPHWSRNDQTMFDELVSRARREMCPQPANTIFLDTFPGICHSAREIALENKGFLAIGCDTIRAIVAKTCAQGVTQLVATCGRSILEFCAAPGVPHCVAKLGEFCARGAPAQPGNNGFHAIASCKRRRVYCSRCAPLAKVRKSPPLTSAHLVQAG
jgi:hypothetical protein